MRQVRGAANDEAPTCGGHDSFAFLQASRNGRSRSIGRWEDPHLFENRSHLRDHGFRAQLPLVSGHTLRHAL